MEVSSGPFDFCGGEETPCNPTESLDLPRPNVREKDPPHSQDDRPHHTPSNGGGGTENPAISGEERVCPGSTGELTRESQKAPRSPPQKALSFL